MKMVVKRVMKRTYRRIAVLSLALLGGLSLALLAGGCICTGETVSPAGASPGTVQHLVLLKFKDGLPPGKVDEVMTDFAGLRSRIPGIVSFQSGTDSSPEGLQKGFTHCALVTFRDRAARDAYLAHPEHEKFKARALPAVADVCVADFEVR